MQLSSSSTIVAGTRSTDTPAAWIGWLDACPYLAAADLLITDHSSVGFEYLLLDRPLIRVDVPELIARTDINPEYVELLRESSTSVRSVEEAVAAVDKNFGDTRILSESRRAVARDLFHEPGTATARAVRELCNVIELDSGEPEIPIRPS
jgi:hypothetical protein